MAALSKSALMVEGNSSAHEDVTVARRATGEAPWSALAPDPEVAATAKRRRFSGDEKRRILTEADRCTKPGELGALMRREGIYSSMLTNWRKQRGQAERAALAPKKRGPKPAANAAEQRELKHLTRENVRLQRELDRAHTIIDVQKKLCTLLGLPTADESDEQK
jgi:transposase-like protein